MKINGTLIQTDLIVILQELKRQLESNGINYLNIITDSGNDVMVQCPFHNNGQERRASAGIRKSDGMFHCFSCNEVHSLPQVISYCFGKDPKDEFFGWNWLLDNFVGVGIEEREPLELNMERVISKEKRIYVSEQELDSYRVIHPYWGHRGITSIDLMNLFDLGYDSKTGCITFNVRNKNGDTLFVARRSVKTKWFNYPKDVEKEVYGIYELYQQKEFPKKVYICESMIDALTLWQNGKYACALNGLGTELQYKQLNEMPCRSFVLATDNDEAGLKARKKLREKLHNKLISEVVLPPGRKDINECTKEEIEGLEEVWG